MASIEDDGILFHVWPDDHPPPHVHVFVAGEELRINLLTDEYMDEPPAGKRRKIMEAYWKHRDALRQLWKEYERERGDRGWLKPSR